MVMQGYGGLLPADEAAERSIGMLECGPAAGVIGSQVLGKLLGHPNVIATDMGGTTFKVSVIQNGRSSMRASRWSIGSITRSRKSKSFRSVRAAGPSFPSKLEAKLAPRVGPRSAGAVPGPVCYGRGGNEPTLTDVFMLIGYMDPEIFLGGTMKLDRGRRHARSKRR